MSPIPPDWTTRPLHELADYRAGRTPARARSEYWTEDGGNMPWVSIADMPEFGAIRQTKESISGLAFKEVFRESIVPAGALLMSFKLTIGRVATLAVPACHNEAIVAIYPRPGIDQRFLGYFLSQIDYSESQDRHIKGNTLNQSKIHQLAIVVPPYHEQAAIADVLDRTRDAIRMQVRKIAGASALKRAAMRELFTRGLRGEEQKETEFGLMPRSWAIAHLGQHFSVSSGGTPSRRQPRFWDEGTIPWVKTAEIDYGIILDTEERITPAAVAASAAKVLPPGTILLAMYGQGVTRGKVAVLGTAAACNQACAALQPKDQSVLPSYLRFFIEFRYEAIRQLAHGGQQQNLNLNIVRGLRIVFPSNVDEQREIVAILDAIDRKIDLHRRKRAVLEELFRTLLHKLMTGEIRVGDLDLSALEDIPPEAHA